MGTHYNFIEVDETDLRKTKLHTYYRFTFEGNLSPLEGQHIDDENKTNLISVSTNTSFEYLLHCILESNTEEYNIEIREITSSYRKIDEEENCWFYVIPESSKVIDIISYNELQDLVYSKTDDSNYDEYKITNLKHKFNTIKQLQKSLQNIRQNN